MRRCLPQWGLVLRTWLDHPQQFFGRARDLGGIQQTEPRRLSTALSLAFIEPRAISALFCHSQPLYLNPDGYRPFSSRRFCFRIPGDPLSSTGNSLRCVNEMMTEAIIAR